MAPSAQRAKRLAPAASPNAVEAVYQTGHWLFTNHRVAHACSVFRAMIYIAPEDERGWLALGACYEARDRVDIAFQLYEAGGATARAAPRCELARARILHARGEWTAAREALGSAERMASHARDEDALALVVAERRRW